MSLSESLEREVKILCLSSIMARWDEREEDLEDDDEDCCFGGDGVKGGFLDFKDLVAIVAVMSA